MTTDEAPTAVYFCGKCGCRWKGERTLQAVGCPKCNNYSTIGVDGDTARALDALREWR